MRIERFSLFFKAFVFARCAIRRNRQALSCAGDTGSQPPWENFFDRPVTKLTYRRFLPG